MASPISSGGQMVIACFCVDNNGYHFGGRTPHAAEALYEQLMECWSEMEAEGRITQVNQHLQKDLSIDYRYK